MSDKFHIMFIVIIIGFISSFINLLFYSIGFIIVIIEKEYFITNKLLFYLAFHLLLNIFFYKEIKKYINKKNKNSKRE